MTNSRECLKKLGITEYPWSSDDEEDTPPISRSLSDGHPLSRNIPAQRASTGTIPGTSGISSSTSARAPEPPQPSTSGSTRSVTRPERDLFWSMINNGPGNTNGNVSRVMPPSAMSSRLPQAPDASSAEAAAVDSRSVAQRLNAIRKFTRALNQQRPNTIIVSRNGANGGGDQSASVRNLLSHLNAQEILANIKARRVKRVYEKHVASSANNTSNSSTGSSENVAEIREDQPSTSGLNRPGQSQEGLDRVDAPVPSTTINVEPSDEGECKEAEIFSTPRGVPPTNEETMDNSAPADMSLEQIVEIDAEPPNDNAESNANNPQPGSSKTTENNTSAEEQPHGVKRKLNDEGPELTIKEFNQSLLRLLECPVCMEWLEPPMAQCRRGHLVCARCQARLAACPVCRTAFSSVRNRAMEAVAELLRYPCRHGCGAELRLRRRTPHEASCEARLYSCAAHACVMKPVPLPLLHKHCRLRHLHMVRHGRAHQFSLSLNAEQRSVWFVMAFREMFQLRLDVDVRAWGVLVYVAYVGPKCRARLYTYQVSVFGQHNSRKLVYSRATHSDLESPTLNVSRQDCFHLTLDQAMNFLRLKNRHCVPDKSLDFHVEIGMCENGDKEDSD